MQCYIMWRYYMHSLRAHLSPERKCTRKKAGVYAYSVNPLIRSSVNPLIRSSVHYPYCAYATSAIIHAYVRALYAGREVADRWLGAQAEARGESSDLLLRCECVVVHECYTCSSYVCIRTTYNATNTHIYIYAYILTYILWRIKGGKK